MATRQAVIAATHMAVRLQLADDRENDSPWPTDRTLGLSGGAGYGFDDDTIRDFVSSCVSRLRDYPSVSDVRNQIAVPAAIPTGSLLGGTVLAFKQWLAFGICGQLGI